MAAGSFASASIFSGCLGAASSTISLVILIVGGRTALKERFFLPGVPMGRAVSGGRGEAALIELPAADIDGLIAVVEQLDPLKIFQLIGGVIEDFVDDDVGARGGATQEADEKQQSRVSHPSTPYAWGVKPRTISNLAASSPMREVLIGAKSMVTDSRCLASLMPR